MDAGGPELERNRGGPAVKRLRRWAAASLIACGALANREARAGCGGGPPVRRASVFRVHNTPIHPRYFHDLSTAQIEGLQSSVKLASRNMREPGLTAAEQALNTSYQCGAMENTRTHRFCVWADSVDVDLSYTGMDVYVSDQYPEGSCPYRVILAHENRHVAINQRVLAKYVVLMRRALLKDRTIPTRDRPLEAYSFEGGQKVIADRVERVIQPLYDRYKNEVIRENHKIDTPASYRRTQAKCSEW